MCLGTQRDSLITLSELFAPRRGGAALRWEGNEEEGMGGMRVRGGEDVACL